MEDLTLDGFDAALNDHAGEVVGFAPAVRRLWEVRTELRARETRRTELRDVLAAQCDRGVTTAGAWRLERVVTRTRRPATVPATVLKKVDYGLWERCKVPRPWVTVHAPALNPGVTPPAPRLPAVPARVRAVEPVVSGYMDLRSSITGLRAEEAALKDQLSAIATRFGWDGVERSWADGWTLGLVALRYSAERLREVAPETFAALAVEPQDRISNRLVLRRADGRTDLDDEEDGQ